MPVYACLYVPEFPAQALVRLRPELRDQPVAVLKGERPFERICSRNLRAARLGVALGAARAEAELFAVSLLQQSLAEEQSTRSALLSCLGAFTPAIEQIPSENACIFVLDLSGTEKLLGSLSIAAQKISAAVSCLGLSARIATGVNFHAVAAMAATQPQRIFHIEPRKEQQTLAPLPLFCLPLTLDQSELFTDWGIQTLGDLAALPELELIARIGQQGRRLRQLARGEHPHHFQPLEAPLCFEEYLEFDAPVDALESLLFALNPMLEQLLYRVRTYACALASLTVSCGLEGAPVHTRTVRPALPTEDRRVLLKLLQLDLETHSPAAGVLTLRLSGETGPASKVQIGLFSPQLPEPMRLEVTLARIAAIVGEGRVGMAVLADTHSEDAFSIHKFDPAPARTSPARTSPAPTSQSQRSIARTTVPALRRFRPPQPIFVEHQSRQLCALWHNTARYTIQRLYGPWRASGGWWNEQAWAATRWDFAAQATDGTLLAGVVLHPAGSQTWLLEGIYD